jgi:hypothetical protein
MTLIEKLEQKRREMDRRVIRSLAGPYDYECAEMRDLLDEVIATIHPPLMMVGDLSDDDLYEQHRMTAYVCRNN